MPLSIIKQFQEELEKGTGKVIFLFRCYYKKVDFTAPLFEAYIYNPDYNPQCFGGWEAQL